MTRYLWWNIGLDHSTAETSVIGRLIVASTRVSRNATSNLRNQNTARDRPTLSCVALAERRHSDNLLTNRERNVRIVYRIVKRNVERLSLAAMPMNNYVTLVIVQHALRSSISNVDVGGQRQKQYAIRAQRSYHNAQELAKLFLTVDATLVMRDVVLVSVKRSSVRVRNGSNVRWDQHLDNSMTCSSLSTSAPKNAADF